MSYGERIRGWRKARGWTMKQLSEELGFSDSYISHWEQEVQIPSLDICLALAEIFRIPPQEQQVFLEEVEAKRHERMETRLRTRGAVVRGAMRTRGIATQAPERTPGQISPVVNTPNVDSQTATSECVDYAELEKLYLELKTAFSNPRLRDSVLHTLRAILQLIRSVT